MGFKTCVTSIALIVAVTVGCGNEMSEREQIEAERQRLRAEFGSLFDEVSGILFELDPIGINFETNTDEYEPEVGTILPRLQTCAAAADVRKVVHEEFVKWFSPADAGLEANYQEAGDRIWAAWERHRAGK